MLLADADLAGVQQNPGQSRRKGLGKGKLTAIVDTSPVHGAGAVADTYELVGGFPRNWSAPRAPSSTKARRPGWSRCARPKPTSTGTTPDARRTHLAELVQKAA